MPGRQAVPLLALMAFGAIAAGSAGCAAHAPRASALLDRARAWGDPPATLRDWQVVGFASRQVGKRYCWGGIGPECYDCSGLVKEAWASVGIRLPHSSDAIPDAVPEVPLTDVRPGDILWWPGHLAIYAGHGWSIEALDRRDGVVVRAVRDPARAFRPRG